MTGQLSLPLEAGAAAARARRTKKRRGSQCLLSHNGRGVCFVETFAHGEPMETGRGFVMSFDYWLDAIVYADAARKGQLRHWLNSRFPTFQHRRLTE